MISKSIELLPTSVYNSVVMQGETSLSRGIIHLRQTGHLGRRIYSLDVQLYQGRLKGRGGGVIMRRWLRFETRRECGGRRTKRRLVVHCSVNMHRPGLSFFQQPSQVSTTKKQGC